MRTLGILLVLMFWSAVANAQRVTVLDEAKIGFAPISSEVTEDGDRFTFVVNESYHREFELNPLAFMDEYFSIENFMNKVAYKKYDSYEVSFNSSKGSLRAFFDKEGNLQKTKQRFVNILLPAELRHQLYRDHKGWEMVKNVYVAKGEGATITKSLYKVKLERDGDKKRIKFKFNPHASNTGVASN
ncbi:hypothetical protein [Salinimicrobium sp. GXAS 041]|uniref:hypothetical protein n=1 Tax=Salinimicrobium sp. GXAS 041 TaxID=3400806 RepID=UPI003C784EBB